MMDPYRSVCAKVVLPLLARREGSRWLEHLEYLERSQYFEPERVREIQLRKLRDMVAHAAHATEYYRSAYSRVGADARDVKSFADFEALPLLRKVELQQRPEEFQAEGVDRFMPYLTSGSTGTPIRGWWDKASTDWKKACGMRSNFWAGYRLGERIACLYGNPERELSGTRKLKALLRRKLVQRTEVLNLLDLAPEAMLAFADRLRRRPPAILWGHAHGLYLLARFYEKQGIMDLRPRGMYSAGMVLHGFERETVERVFGGVLQDRYGCEELGMIAAECRTKEGLHVNVDDLYVEFLGADGRPVAAGERGAIVVTDLSNRAMPLIRYRMEDVGVPSARRCSCGRTQPLIERIEGRVADFLITPEGRLVSGISLTDHFAGQIPGVAQMQIVQKKRDLLVLVVVKGAGFSEASEREVQRLVREFFGPAMRHRFNFVAEIPSGVTGKRRFTICEVPHELL